MESSRFKPGGFFASTLQSVRSPDDAATPGDVSSLSELKRNEPERSFPFLRINEREAKPRKRGLTGNPWSVLFGCRAAVP